MTNQNLFSFFKRNIFMIKLLANAALKRTENMFIQNHEINRLYKMLHLTHLQASYVFINSRLF